jgi:hypothetical protein
MVQSTPPSYARDGMPLFSDPRFTEHLYHYQCRYLNNTTSRVDCMAPQMDQLKSDFKEMSAELSFLRKTFQHFIDMHFAPLQDALLPPGSPTLGIFCKCLVSRLTRDFLFASSPTLFQVRTDNHSLRSPLSVFLTVPIQSPISSGSGNIPPLESITNSPINSSLHSLSSSDLLLICPPQNYETARSYWSQDSDSKLSEETGQDGDSDHSEEVGEELWEGFSASGVRNNSV